MDRPTEVTMLPEVTMPTQATMPTAATIAVPGALVTPPQRRPLPDGATFGNYVIERNLDRGGMGMVYLVRHTVIGSQYALKILDPDVAARDGDFVKRFIREAKLAGQMRHPNLIGVYDAGLDAATGLYYIVMDYVGGGTLRARLKEKGRLEESEAVAIVRSVAAALAAAKGVVHRDIKPENILFDTDGTVRLTDLGIAKAMEVPVDDFKSRAESVFGTPAYMSPEQVMDSATVDTRADIWSLGIVFYEMLAGERPFPASRLGEVIAELIKKTKLPDVRTKCPSVSAHTAEIVARMLEKDVKNRIPSADALIKELGEETELSTASDEATASAPTPPRWPLRVMIAFMAVIIVLIIGFLVMPQNLPQTGTPQAETVGAANVPAEVHGTDATSSKPVQMDAIGIKSPQSVSEGKSPSPAEETSSPTSSASPMSSASSKSPSSSTLMPPSVSPDSSSPNNAPVAPPRTDLQVVWVGRGLCGIDVPGAVLEPQTSKDLERKLAEAISRRPQIVLLCLSPMAAKLRWTPDRFEMEVGKIAKSLQDAGVASLFVTGVGGARAFQYDAALGEVCARSSLDVCRFDELGAWLSRLLPASSKASTTGL